MCRFTTLYRIDEAENLNQTAEMIRVPAVVGYQYPLNAIVHPKTTIPTDDTLHCFKVLLEHEKEPVYIIKDNGSVYGFTMEEVVNTIYHWYACEAVNEDERDEMLQYFISWFDFGWCSIRDVITSLSRTFHWCPQNWLMYYVIRVDLRGMIPPEWFDMQLENRLYAWDREIRANIPPVIRANSPVMANSDIFDGNMSDLDGETIGSIDTWSIQDMSDPTFDIEFTDSEDDEDN